mgnify:CR=1 FL=1
MLRKLVNAGRRDDLPPPLETAPIDSEEHKRLMDSAHHDIMHRERILRALEARANVLGQDFREDK